MQALTFKRGVHPPDGKALSAEQPIQVILPKENSELFYPMSQHIGAPCEPLVAVGDYVKVGQKIAESPAFMSSPIFASVSGLCTCGKHIITVDMHCQISSVFGRSRNGICGKYT